MTGVQGRRILITGAGTGIGATTATLLAQRGARVAILDRDAQAAEAMARQLGDEQGIGWGGDVTDPAAVDAVLEAMTARWGGIDDLVNNAGTWDHGTLLELSTERWRKVFEVNLMAPIAISNAAVPRMSGEDQSSTCPQSSARSQHQAGALTAFRRAPSSR